MARAELRDDPQRPQCHFLPPAHWQNDPNGLIQWRGRYHLFYQHNPHGPLWGDMHWGHAISNDLVHWRDLPIALAPTPGRYDEDGVFSGCAVDNDGVPSILYTGVRGNDQLVCLATCDATDTDLVRWRKWPGNPVIPEPPSLDLVAYRDPSVSRAEDGTWLMVHGAGIVGKGGAALLYRSSDLRSWEYAGPLLVGDPTGIAPSSAGSLWECPQLFPLEDRHVLLVSVWDGGEPQRAEYMVGTFDGRRFSPERHGVLGSGVLYAPQTMQDDVGRRLLWGWLREGRSYQAMAASRWNGVMSLPWELSLRDDSTLGMRPVPELTVLRREHAGCENIELSGGTEHCLDRVHGPCVEILAVFECSTAARVGLIVRRSPGGEEQTRIVYEPETGRLTIDRGRSSIDRPVDEGDHASTLPPGEDRLLRLHVFLDRSVIEVFANEQVVVTGRVYPTRPDSMGIGVFAEGRSARLRSLDAWIMESIWAETGASGFDDYVSGADNPVR